jgi:hypothetical protein
VIHLRILDRISGQVYRDRVRRLVFAALALSLCLAGTAEGAWPTQVLSAVEKHKTLPDLNIEVTWDRLLKQAKITREWIQTDMGERTDLDVKELRYKEVTQRLLIDLRVGLYHDLEFHLQVPIVLQNRSDVRFASGVEGQSTIFGSPNADDPNYNNSLTDLNRNNYRYPITNVPASRERSGFGDMTFGLSWSPLNDRKDEAFPTLTFRADVITPTGKTRDPTDQAALPGGGGGSVGLGMTVFDLSIGLSRRMRTEIPTFDPYMIFGAQLPIATATQKARGMEPSPTGRFLVGTEILISEDQPSEQRYALDLSFGVKYIGIARTYSELSDYLPNFNQTRVDDQPGRMAPKDVVRYEDYDNPSNYAVLRDGASCGRAEGGTSGISGVPCGELNRVDEYLQLQSQLALHVRPARFALFRMGVGFGVNTDHFLTTERVGVDRDRDDLTPAENNRCVGGCKGRVNASNADGVDERSPYYDPRYDTPGRRLRIEETTHFTLFVTGAATF